MQSYFSTAWETPKVSVVMPAYNAGMFVSEAIVSIQKQTLKQWELIIVDDGSTDNTRSILQAFASEDQRIRLLSIPHVGVSKASNEGLKYVRSPFIARMDSDDVALPARLELQVAFLEKHPQYGAVSTGVELIAREGEERSDGLQRYVDWVNSLVTHQDISLGRFVDLPVIHPSGCIRKDVFDELGAYRHGNFPEDYEWWLRLLQHGVKVGKIDQTLLRWRDHSGKLTRTHPRYEESALWSIKGVYFRKWFERNCDHERPLLVWGSGRKTRSRMAHFGALLDAQHMDAFVDVSPRKVGTKIGGVPVILPMEIERFENSFVIGMVGSRGARELIRAELESQGKRHGHDFIFVA